jgi:hypothetical protein
MPPEHSFFVLPGAHGLPVLVPVVGRAYGSQFEDRLGDSKIPTSPGDIHAVAHEVGACAFDDYCFASTIIAGK